MGANEGFQSKMNCDVGSYVIHGFWRRATALFVETGAVPLKVIFKEIQDDLGAYKQMPVFTWNNDTELVVLKPCKTPLKPAEDEVSNDGDNGKMMSTDSVAQMVDEDSTAIVYNQQNIEIPTIKK